MVISPEFDKKVFNAMRKEAFFPFFEALPVPAGRTAASVISPGAETSKIKNDDSDSFRIVLPYMLPMLSAYSFSLIFSPVKAGAIRNSVYSAVSSGISFKSELRVAGLNFTVSVSPPSSLRSESAPPVSAVRMSALCAFSEMPVFPESDKESSVKPAF